MNRKTPAALSEQDLRILTHYAAGTELKGIATIIGIDREDVLTVVEELTGFERKRAGDLVCTYNKKQHKKAADAEPVTKPETAVTVEAREPKPPAFVKPVITPSTIIAVGAPVPPGPATPTVPDINVEPRQLSASITDILSRAQEAGGKFAARAARIRAMVAALDSDLAEWERVADAERRVQELRRQLEDANAQLREVRGGSKPAAETAATGDIPTDAQLRRWAASAGVPCGAVGRVGSKVIAAWRAAGSPNLDSEVAA